MFFTDGKAVSGDRISLLGLGNLQITNIQESDDGVYVCNVLSPVGTVTSQGRLTVLGWFYGFLFCGIDGILILAFLDILAKRVLK